VPAARCEDRFRPSLKSVNRSVDECSSSLRAALRRCSCGPEREPRRPVRGRRPRRAFGWRSISAPIPVGSAARLSTVT